MRMHLLRGWWLAVAMIVVCGTPVEAQGRLDADTFRLYGGTYQSDCRDATAPRVTIFEEAVVLLEGNSRIAGKNVQGTASYFGNSPPEGYETTFMSEGDSGAQFLCHVFRDQTGEYLTIDGDAGLVARISKAALKLKYRRCGVPAKAVTIAPRPAALTPTPDTAMTASGMLTRARFKTAYYRALGPLVRESWLAELDGPSPNNQRVRVAGGDYLLVCACKNHDCGDNNTVLLYSATRRLVYGLVYLRGRSRLIGAPPPAVARALEPMWRAEWRQGQ